MVFEKLKNFIEKRRDVFDTKGLEQFSPAQQERILGRIGAKEDELLERKADIVLAKRLKDMERRSGIRSPRSVGPGDALKKSGDALNRFKEFRQNNLRRNAEKNKESSIKKSNPDKLQIKEVRLKAPGS